LRGTALEYLDAALPPDIRDSLWLFLEGVSAKRSDEPKRPREAIVADLLAANQSIQFNPAKLKGSRVVKV
jgi:hypothetical protein